MPVHGPEIIEEVLLRRLGEKYFVQRLSPFAPPAVLQQSSAIVAAVATASLAASKQRHEGCTICSWREGRYAALPALQEKATARWAQAQHRAIDALLASIEGLLRGLIEVEPGADQAGQALRHLEHLARELPEHFAREEAADGIFAKALAVEPRLERRVLALRRQHASLGAELEQILEHAGYAGVALDAWRRVAETFGAFAEALRTHEHAENRIVADAYLEELGTGD